MATRYDDVVTWRLVGDKVRAQQFMAAARTAIGIMLDSNRDDLGQITHHAQLAEDVVCRVHKIPGAILCEIQAGGAPLESESMVAGFIVEASDGQTGVIAWSTETQTWRWIPRSRFNEFAIAPIVWKNDAHAYCSGWAEERHALLGAYFDFAWADSSVYRDGKTFCQLPYGVICAGAAFRDDEVIAVGINNYSNAVYRATAPFTSWSTYPISGVGQIVSPALFDEEADTASFVTRDWGVDDAFHAVTINTSGDVVSDTPDSAKLTQYRTSSSNSSSSSDGDVVPETWSCEGAVEELMFYYEMPDCATYWSMGIVEYMMQPLPYVQAPGRAWIYGYDTEGILGPGSTLRGWPGCLRTVAAMPPDTASGVYRPEIWSACGGSCGHTVSDFIGTDIAVYKGATYTGSANSSSNSTHAAYGTPGNLLIATDGNVVVRSRQDAFDFVSNTTCVTSYSQVHDYEEETTRYIAEVVGITPDYYVPDCTWNANNAFPMPQVGLRVETECTTPETVDYSESATSNSTSTQSYDIRSVGLPTEMLAEASYSTSAMATGSGSVYEEKDCFALLGSRDSSFTFCEYDVWNSQSTTKFPLGFDLRCGAMLYVHTDRVTMGSTEPGAAFSTYSGHSTVRLRLPAGTEVVLAELDFPVCFVGMNRSFSEGNCEEVGTTTRGLVCPHASYDGQSYSYSSTTSEQTLSRGAQVLFSRWRGFPENDGPRLMGGLISRNYFGAGADIYASELVFQCNQDIFGHWLISVRVVLQQITLSNQLVGLPITITYSSLDEYVGDPTDIMNVSGENRCFEKVSVMGWRKLDH